MDFYSYGASLVYEAESPRLRAWVVHGSDENYTYKRGGMLQFFCNFVMARRSTRITCPQGGSITVDDGIQRLDFFDLQMIVVPNVPFSGTVEFFLGDIIVKTVAYVNERKIASFYSIPSDTIPGLFPATENNPFNRDAGEDGSELRASVKITETGNATSVVCKVHFLRRLISMRT